MQKVFTRSCWSPCRSGDVGRNRFIVGGEGQKYGRVAWCSSEGGEIWQSVVLVDGMTLRRPVVVEEDVGVFGDNFVGGGGGVALGHGLFVLVESEKKAAGESDAEAGEVEGCDFVAPGEDAEDGLEHVLHLACDGGGEGRRELGAQVCEEVDEEGGGSGEGEGEGEAGCVEVLAGGDGCQGGGEVT